MVLYVAHPPPPPFFPFPPLWQPNSPSGLETTLPLNQGLEWGAALATDATRSYLPVTHVVISGNMVSTEVQRMMGPTEVATGVIGRFQVYCVDARMQPMHRSSDSIGVMPRDCDTAEALRLLASAKPVVGSSLAATEQGETEDVGEGVDGEVTVADPEAARKEMLKLLLPGEGGVWDGTLLRLLTCLWVAAHEPVTGRFKVTEIKLDGPSQDMDADRYDVFIRVTEGAAGGARQAAADRAVGIPGGARSRRRRRVFWRGSGGGGGRGRRGRGAGRRSGVRCHERKGGVGDAGAEDESEPVV